MKSFDLFDLIFVLVVISFAFGSGYLFACYTKEVHFHHTIEPIAAACVELTAK